MPVEFFFTVEPTFESLRIDKYLSGQIEQLSRSRIQQLIKNRSIELNGVILEQSKEKIKPGDRIRVCLPPPTPSEVLPEPIPFEILYQDEYLAVINKPPGLCVHPTEHRKTGTLVNGLLYALKDLSGIGGVLRPGIVHRLDQGTSGILVVAKRDDAHQVLSAMFKSREIRKIYWAIVYGSLSAPTGEINQPIGRHPHDRKQMTLRQDGRKSLTYYRILRRGLGGMLLEVYPKTGRTHQIRVHLRHLGVSIVNDTLYGLKKFAGKGTLGQLFEGYPGIALHAKAIFFRHPATGEEMTFDAPLPAIFQEALESMTPVYEEKSSEDHA